MTGEEWYSLYKAYTEGTWTVDEFASRIITIADAVARIRAKCRFSKNMVDHDRQCCECGPWVAAVQGGDQ